MDEVNNLDIKESYFHQPRLLAQYTLHVHITELIGVGVGAILHAT